MESRRRFSTEKHLKFFHSDSFRGFDKVKKPQRNEFYPQTTGFPNSVHIKSPDKPQIKRQVSKKILLSDNDIFNFHSFHALYGYYCWYSYVFLGIVSCCQTRVRAKPSPRECRSSHRSPITGQKSVSYLL